MLEIRAVKTPVAGKQPVGLAERVRANHKISHNPGPLPALLPVRFPGFPGFKRGVNAQGAEPDIPITKHLLSDWVRREMASGFRPDNFTGDKLAFGGTETERLF